RRRPEDPVRRRECRARGAALAAGLGARVLMRDWSAHRVAEAAGARLVGPPPASDPSGPARVTIDSRDVGPGDLFVGLPGTRVDGGRFAATALAAGAWGVLVAPEHAQAAQCARPGALLAADD